MSECFAFSLRKKRSVKTPSPIASGDYSASRLAAIAVIGATGNQGGGVVRALQASGEFHVRALTRNPSEHQGVGDEVVEADLTVLKHSRPRLKVPTVFSL
jgi:predicted dinucleotide-binding enzyme